MYVFRVLGGCHSENGQVVKKGDVFSSPIELDKRYANKFEKMDPSTKLTKDIYAEDVQEAAEEGAKDLEPVKVMEDTGKFVVEATEANPDLYNIFEEGEDAPLNPEPVGAKQINAFLTDNK